jgi:hypothetical protein
MTDLLHDAFGRPLVSFDRLTLEEKVRLLRADLPAWRYGRCGTFVGAWLAEAFDDFLQHGGDLVHLLGLKPARGSRNTVQRIGRLRERDVLLVRLSVAVGTAARAQRVLAGAEPCPKVARPLVEALKAHAAPSSKSAFSRARKVARHGR